MTGVHSDHLLALAHSPGPFRARLRRAWPRIGRDSLCALKRGIIQSRRRRVPSCANKLIPEARSSELLEQILRAKIPESEFADLVLNCAVSPLIRAAREPHLIVGELVYTASIHLDEDITVDDKVKPLQAVEVSAKKADGTAVHFVTTCRIDTVRWRELSAKATALELPPQSGVVICDKMRIQLDPARPQAAVAPASLPPTAADWLKQLAAAIEEAGAIELASTLRARLEQFVVR